MHPRPGGTSGGSSRQCLMCHPSQQGEQVCSVGGRDGACGAGSKHGVRLLQLPLQPLVASPLRDGSRVMFAFAAFAAFARLQRSVHAAVRGLASHMFRWHGAASTSCVLSNVLHAAMRRIRPTTCVVQQEAQQEAVWTCTFAQYVHSHSRESQPQGAFPGDPVDSAACMT